MMAETWCSAVFGEMLSRRAIWALLSPLTSKANTSDCRPVSPAGLARVLAIGSARDGARTARAQLAAQTRGGRNRPRLVEECRVPRAGRPRRPRERERLLEGQPSAAQPRAASRHAPVMCADKAH